MTKNKKIMLFALIAIVIGVVLSGCGSSSKNTPPATKQQQQASNAIGLKTFTLDELKKYDGQNGASAYVAVDGKVYDVTNASQWKNGIHKGYKAGKDLTKEIKASPHGESVLNQVPVVGTLLGS